MEKHFLFVGATLICGLLQSQINVHECTPENSTITQQEFIGPEAEIAKSCVWFDGHYTYTGNQQKTILATEEIHISGDFQAKPTGDGEVHFQGGLKGVFDVFCMNYPDLLHVLKYEKLELGVILPNAVQEKIDKFINEGGPSGVDKINPYLDWDIRISFDFKHPQIPYSINVDGFYNKEYASWMLDESQIPEFDTPQPNSVVENFPLLNLQGVYNTLGGYTEVPTAYPFLGRFSPPRTGKWECSVHLYLPNNENYHAEPFYFTVIESDNPGYVKVANDGRSLELGGHLFHPVGANILWPMTYETKFNPGVVSPKLQKLLINPGTGFLSEEYRSLHPLPVLYDNYRNLIRNMADGGANFVRLIMHPFSIDIEFEKLGDYTDRLYQAQELDEILEYCESRNVYIDWDMMIQYVHQTNSYNVGWNGMLEGKSYAYKSLPDINNQPVNFFTNDVAKAFYKQRLRYILARWGYSTNIAMFELYSEIGDEHTTPERAVINQQWQSEMAAYISERPHGITHLIQPSYAGLKVKADETFRDENIDVMTTNIYPGLKTYAQNWIDHIQRDYLDQTMPELDSTYSLHCVQNSFVPGTTCYRNTKPFFMPEFNPNLELCDELQIEVRRAMWQAPFSGAVGGLSWYSYKNGIVFPEYAKIRTFLENMNEKGGWHPGAMKLQSDGRLEYMSNWAEDMDKHSKKADLMYMRSNDRNYAIGVITNKTYNIETVDGCIENGTWPPEFDDLMKESQTFTTNTEGLFLNGMNSGKYYINYFYTHSQGYPYDSDDQNGSRIKLKTFLSNEDDKYIILFMARKTGHNWLPQLEESMTQLTTSKQSIEKIAKVNVDNEILYSDSEDERDLNIYLYPVPTDDKIKIELSHLIQDISVSINTIDGKKVGNYNLNNISNEISVKNLEKGVYLFDFYSNESFIEQKKIIKL